jgi:Xaa-Pro aminopeptidase
VVRTKGASDVGKVAAGNYLRDLREIGKRVCAYSLMLGEARSEQLWSRIKSAMAEVELLVDDPIIERFQLIREEIEADRIREAGIIGEDE